MPASSTPAPLTRTQRVLIYFGLREDPRSADDGYVKGIDWFYVVAPFLFGGAVAVSRDPLFGALVALGLLPLALAAIVWAVGVQPPQSGRAPRLSSPSPRRSSPPSRPAPPSWSCSRPTRPCWSAWQWEPSLLSSRRYSRSASLRLRASRRAREPLCAARPIGRQVIGPPVTSR